MNLHVHFHTLALVGVYVPGATADAESAFVRAPEPTAEQAQWLCDRVATRARPEEGMLRPRATPPAW